MFILKLAGKILLLPVWLILFVIGLAVKMTVQTYAVVRGILVYLYRTDFVTGIAEDRKKERVNL